MAAVAVAPGNVEQAIYTWSKHKVGGGRGQGIGEVSAGLREQIGWLSSLDLSRLRPFADNSNRETDRYEGWRQMVAVGMLPVGHLNIVFRALASAGRDASGRNRFLVQLLVGRANELDLSSVSIDDDHWLPAEACPLDELPRLSVLDVADLKPHRAVHDCNVLDGMAQDLLAQLIEGGGAATRPERDTSMLTTALLVSLPSALWGEIGLSWSVGREGPVATIAVESGGQAPEETGKAMRAGLGDCEFHRGVERIWSNLPARERCWGRFVEAYRRKRAGADGSVTEPTVADSARPSSHSLHELVTNEIATAIGAPRWDAGHRLSDAEATHVVTRLEALSDSRGQMLDAFSSSELNAVFSAVETNVGFSRCLRFFENAHTPAEALAARWRETSLAVLGFAAASRMPEDGSGSWAVPKRINQEQLERLVAHLRRLDGAAELLAKLLDGGFAQSAESRRSMIDALRAAGARAQEIYAFVIPAASLAPRVEAQFMHENIDLMVEWLGVPPQSAEAFRYALEHRRRFVLPSIFNAYKRFDRTPTDLPDDAG